MSRRGGGPGRVGVMAVFCGRLPCVVWATGGWFVRHCSSSASGGTSGRRPRKVVSLVVRAGRGGAVECRSGGFERLTTSRCMSLCCVGDEEALEVGRWRIRHHFWRMVLWMLFSSPLLERPESAPPLAGTASSFWQWWELN
jgi:hypothetical protein